MIRYICVSLVIRMSLFCKFELWVIHGILAACETNRKNGSCAMITRKPYPQNYIYVLNHQCLLKFHHSNLYIRICLHAEYIFHINTSFYFELMAVNIIYILKAFSSSLPEPKMVSKIESS